MFLVWLTTTRDARLIAELGPGARRKNAVQYISERASNFSPSCAAYYPVSESELTREQSSLESAIEQIEKEFSDRWLAGL